MKGFKFSVLLSALAIALPTSLPTAAIAQPVRIAQNTSLDSAYLEDLYGFLQGQDSTTYAMATEAMTPEQSVWAAQMFCQTFSAGISPAEAYDIYTTSAVTEASNYGAATEEMLYAIGLYGGAVMNLGSAHYCPEYQTQVLQALQTL
jgi:hypothetical protein